MKRIFSFALLLALSAVPGARAQDAATEERLTQLSARIEELVGAKTEQDRRIAALAKEVEALRGQVDKPAVSAATPEDVKRLADAVREVDQKRIDDYEKIRVELQKLGRAVSAPAPPSRKPASGSSTRENTREGTRGNPGENSRESGTSTTVASASDSSDKPGASDKGHYEYVIKRGDTLSLIAKAYRDEKIPVTVDQILKANPGLKADKLVVGKKISIPAPEAAK